MDNKLFLFILNIKKKIFQMNKRLLAKYNCFIAENENNCFIFSSEQTILKLAGNVFFQNDLNNLEILN